MRSLTEERKKGVEMSNLMVCASERAVRRRQRVMMQRKKSPASGEANLYVSPFCPTLKGFVNRKHLFLQSDWSAYFLPEDAKIVFILRSLYGFMLRRYIYIYIYIYIYNVNAVVV